MFRVLMASQQSVVFAVDIHQIHHPWFDRSEAQVCFRKGDRDDGSRDRYRTHAVGHLASERFFEFLESSQLRIAQFVQVASLLLREQVTVSEDRRSTNDYSCMIQRLRQRHLPVPSPHDSIQRVAQKNTDA